MATGNVTAIEKGVSMLSLCDGAIISLVKFSNGIYCIVIGTECYNKTIELVNISDGEERRGVGDVDEL